MKIIIKIGTSSLSKEDGAININIIQELAKTIYKLMSQGHDVLLVTSGAVGCGKSLIKKANDMSIHLKDDAFSKKETYSTVEKTVLSGMGQGRLLSYYAHEFEKTGLLVEQVLIAGEKDINNSFFNDNIDVCFKIGIVPIINANDTVYDKELVENANKRFSDNDILAAELAHSIRADVLILITNVSGYIDENNKVVSEIRYEEIDEFIANTKKSVSLGGTGGMHSKLSTCKIAGCNTYIIHNSQICNIDLLLRGERIGTKIIVG